MEFIRITSIDNPHFPALHQLLSDVFPQEEVLEYELWREPLEDPSIRVFVAVHEGCVVGTTEYRYYPQWNVAMTDFTIIGVENLGVGPFLANARLADLQALARENGKELAGMFAEIYNPYLVEHHEFGGIKPMDPFVRREVLAHLGYKKCNFDYVHPSWKNDGEAVSGLDFCYLPLDGNNETISSSLVIDFLTTYYAVLSNKPEKWLTMVEQLKSIETIKLVAI